MSEQPSQIKERIIKKAQQGVFDRNPLLSTIHNVTCDKCNHTQSVIFADRLKVGEFQLGKRERIEVFTSHGTIGFSEMQHTTPVVINLVCEQCGDRIEARPVSAEYLLVIIEKPTTSGTFYV